ncbi:MAG TPA: hypothetical protein VFA46_21545 [Actinomycetes bacterium]|nr:hypothetical protein [Actinomycetes bacterium]
MTTRPTTLPDHLADACVLVTVESGLAFAGLDLILTPQGEAVCLEINPSPAHSAYDESTGQPISDALARYLVAG